MPGLKYSKKRRKSKKEKLPGSVNPPEGTEYSFSLNEKILANESGTWWAAQVKQRCYLEDARDECYFVHYRGWKNTWDEWIPLKSKRITQFDQSKVGKACESAVDQSSSVGEKGSSEMTEGVSSQSSTLNGDVKDDQNEHALDQHESADTPDQFTLSLPDCITQLLFKQHSEFCEFMRQGDDRVIRLPKPKEETVRSLFDRLFQHYRRNSLRIQLESEKKDDLKKKHRKRLVIHLRNIQQCLDLLRSMFDKIVFNGLLYEGSEINNLAPLLLRHLLPNWSKDHAMDVSDLKRIKKNQTIFNQGALYDESTGLNLFRKRTLALDCSEWERKNHRQSIQNGSDDKERAMEMAKARIRDSPSEVFGIEHLIRFLGLLSGMQKARLMVKPRSLSMYDLVRMGEWDARMIPVIQHTLQSVIIQGLTECTELNQLITLNQYWNPSMSDPCHRTDLVSIVELLEHWGFQVGPEIDTAMDDDDEGEKEHPKSHTVFPIDLALFDRLSSDLVCPDTNALSHLRTFPLPSFLLHSKSVCE